MTPSPARVRVSGAQAVLEHAAVETEADVAAHRAVNIVMRGEMNIVGPRPERPTIFAELRGHIAEYPLRQRAKPGITGLAQINHHYDRSLDDVRTKVRYDLEYIRRRSLGEDLRIMLQTIPVIFLRRGGW